MWVIRFMGNRIDVVMRQVRYLLKITHIKLSHGAGVLSTEDDTNQI